MTDSHTDSGTAAHSAAAIAAARLRAVEESTATLLRETGGLTPQAVTEPSALPGWTKGHVLTHIARNADSLVNLLNGARTGEDIPQYASPTARDEDIALGAPRPLAEQLADLAASHERFMAAAAQLPDEAWTVQIRHRSGYLFPAYELPLKRQMEIEYHLVDLGADYTPGQWPTGFAEEELPRLAEQFEKTEGLPTLTLAATDTDQRAALGTGPEQLTVQGPVRALAAWLSGRSDGHGLLVHRDGTELDHTALPQLPPMG
ncbi:maleylpyruvate isomerase [Kitasatospora gansuensis]|uniref:Maleylpyruvate isomerase n=1 Tax=Kitasatospora gansuensis TaxID=258050 RepID=A0A7W7WGR2_9ACTN|nr:maleylpyruvate isomerase family mycothiol-dependent enzyme [Kitasatospora gansuensis]MBB4946378.1 maleylpyruvate isomerase [Kitasatospora gansuensis]